MATMSGDGGLASPVPPSEESADDFFGQPSRGRRGQANRGDQLNEEEQFRMFQRFMEQQRRPGRRGLRDESDEEDGGTNATSGRGNAGPPPEWDGTTTFEDYQIRARLWIATTKNRPQIRGPLLLKALKGAPFESFKYLAKDQNWLDSKTNAEELLQKMDTPDHFGEDKEEHLLSSLSRITFHMKRQKQEGWREYFARWEVALRKVREHHVDLPEPYLGFLLINGLRLEEQEIRSMLTFTQGDIKPSSIKSWLRKNESKLTVNQLGADNRKTTNAVMMMEKEDDEPQEESDYEIAELETYLAELHDNEHGSDPKDEEIISEREAAEILATVLEKKRKSFHQTVKAKKYQELSRGYGLRGNNYGKGGKPAFRKKGGNMMIEELKLRTRCGICKRVGHWHRECPNKESGDIGKNPGAHEKEAHYLSRGPEFDTNSEAYFCGLLDALPGDAVAAYDQEFVTKTEDHEIGESSPTERHEWTLGPSAVDRRGTNSVPTFESFPEDLLEIAGSTDSFERQHSAAYTESVFDLFHFENVLSKCSHIKKTSYFHEETCATIDTGCQRLAIGLDTLFKLQHHLPSPLEIHTIRSENRFKSVHGVSTTKRIANVPSSLGTKGCILRPAIFEDSHGRHAPFLLSLPLLMHGGSTLCLEPNHGLFLQLGSSGEKVPCHLGPTGALRVPILNFTPEKLCCLSRDLEIMSKEEFEILTIDTFSCDAENSANIKPEPGSPPVNNFVPEDQLRHGRRLQQEAEKRPELQCSRSMEVTSSSPVAADRAPDPDLGKPAEDHDQTSCGRKVTTQSQQLELPGRPSSLRDTTEINYTSTSGDLDEPYTNSLVEKPDVHPQEEGTDRRSTRNRNLDGSAPKVPLHFRESDLDGFHRRPKLRESVLEMSKTHGTPVSVFPMERISTNGRLGSMEVHGGRVRQQVGTSRDHPENDPTEVQSRTHHQSGIQRLPDSCDMSNLPEGLGEEEQESREQCELGQLQQPREHGGEHTAAVQAVHGVAKDAQPKVIRQIKSALKKAISFWKTIQQVLSFHGADDDTATRKLKQLNEEILDDLIRNPKGSKRTQAVAEAMHLELRSLKTIAEIYNPGCFGRFSQKHGLEAGKAFDLSLGFDLLEARNREHVREYIKTIRPGLVLIAPPCHMYSQLQNLLKDFREQDPIAMRKYLEKKSKAKILLNYAIEIAELCRELGLTFVLEHPWSAESWSTRMMEKLIQHHDVFLSRTDQCLFGLKSDSGNPHRKRTGFATNNEEIYKILNKHCQGQHEHEAIIGGNLSKKSQQYPDALLHAVLRAYSKSIRGTIHDHRSSQQILQQDFILDQWFAETVAAEKSGGDSMTAKLHDVLLGEHALLHDADDDLPEPSEDELPGLLPVPAEGALPPDPEEDLQPGGRRALLPHQRGATLKTLVRRAHEGLGHPHKERFLKILKFSKASEEVMQIARDFQCAACARNQTVKPARRAAPPREIEVNEIVGVDVVWLPRQDGRTQPALNIIDWHTHFQMMIPMENKKPESVREAYRHWVRFFGPPITIALDLGREFEGCFALRAEADGSFVDPSSVESPYQRGITERAGKTFKLMLSKAMETYDCQNHQEWCELVDIVAMQKNRLLMQNGFSPIQRVIGYTPKIPGGLLCGDAANRSFAEHIRLGDGGVERAMKMRKAASIAFHEADCSLALRRAIESGPRPFQNYEIGETVYFWRIGMGPTRKPAPAYWHGPAKVVMTSPPTTVWVSYQGTLVKASPERLRRASEEEMTTLSGWIDALVDTRQTFEKEPKRGFLDLSEEPLPDNVQADQEVLPDQDQPEEDAWQGPLPPVERRLRAKTRVREEEEDDVEVIRAEVDDLFARAGIGVPEPDHPADMEEDSENPSGIKRDHPEGETFEENIEPALKRSRMEYLEIYMLKINNLINARQRKEVQIQALSKRNQECFRKAMEKEVNNNIKTGAYIPLSLQDSAKVRKEQPEKIMESRYVNTAKPLEPMDIEPAKNEGLLLDWDSLEPCKAKSRHVMKGFSEDGAEYLDSTTPQVTREGVTMVTQIIATFQWRLGFLDFTQAFHSGDAIQRTIFAEQPREGVPGMVPGQLIKLLKTCYGLTDGPFAWFSHIRRVLVEELGYTQSIADPCIFMLHSTSKGSLQLRGIIGLATDDMIHGGDELHQEKMEEIKKRYKLGKFQFDEGKFTGKMFRKDPDGSIFVWQPNYADSINKIEIDKERKKHRYTMCDEKEVSLLRTALGALSWLSKETRPELSGRVALLQQSMPHPRIQDLVEANLLINDAKKFSQGGIRFMPISPQNLRVGVISDASWGNAKQDSALEEGSPDYWEETPSHWIRHHLQPRRVLFHPGATLDGPDLHLLQEHRETVFDCGEPLKDRWTQAVDMKTMTGGQWKGKTLFAKQPAGKTLPHENINELFLKMLNTSSQGGLITMFYDQQLEEKEEPQMISLASWKSTRLKRKTVNTLSAECQSMINAVGNVHWFRFLLLEIMGHNLTQEAWENQLMSIPYVAVTDSKSLFDCLNKLVCTYTQTTDKRTAIDIAILKDDMKKSGGHVRWVEGSNMLCDSLTKRMKGGFLRAVADKGFWTLNMKGHQKQKAEFDLLFLQFRG